MKTGEKGIALIKKWESLHDGDLSEIGLQPKLCPAGIWTEGWGHAMRHGGNFLTGEENKALAYKISKVKTEQEAELLLKQDLAIAEAGVLGQHLHLNQNEFDAVVSLVFNIGLGAFLGSTLLKRIKADLPGITDAFMMWNKARVKGQLVELRGLTARRQDEVKLYKS